MYTQQGVSLSDNLHVPFSGKEEKVNDIHTYILYSKVGGSKEEKAENGLRIRQVALSITIH